MKQGTPSYTAPQAVQDAATHVLAWNQPVIGRASWELTTVADFFEPPLLVISRSRPPFPEAARSATAGELAPWVTGQLGWPVSLVADTNRYQTRLLGPMSDEPMYWVIPADRS